MKRKIWAEIETSEDGEHCAETCEFFQRYPTGLNVPLCCCKLERRLPDENLR